MRLTGAALVGVEQFTGCALALDWQPATAGDRGPARGSDGAGASAGRSWRQPCRPCMRRAMSAWALTGHGPAAAGLARTEARRIAKPMRITGAPI